MTARELIKVLQDLGEENLDLEVLIYDEHRYVNIDDVEILTEKNYKDEDITFIGID